MLQTCLILQSHFGKYIRISVLISAVCLFIAYDIIYLSIQGWEWADTVGASADKPILFHELKTREENYEWEDYGVPLIGRSIPNSRERVSELRRLVNLHASDLL